MQLGFLTKTTPEKKNSPVVVFIRFKSYHVFMDKLNMSQKSREQDNLPEELRFQAGTYYIQKKVRHVKFRTEET